MTKNKTVVLTKNKSIPQKIHNVCLAPTSMRASTVFGQMSFGEDERVNVPVCVLDVLLSASYAQRRWKMTQADKHVSNFPSQGRQKHGQTAIFNLFVELFPSVVLTSEGTGEHGLRRLQKHDGVQATQSNMNTLKWSSKYNANRNGKINGLTHDGCLFWLCLAVECP